MSKGPDKGDAMMYLAAICLILIVFLFFSKGSSVLAGF